MTACDHDDEEQTRVHNPRPRGSESIADLLVKISGTPASPSSKPAKGKLAPASNGASGELEGAPARLGKITEEETEAVGSSHPSEPERKYKLSALRWPTLIAFCTIGYMNGISNEHGSILNVYMDTLDIRIESYVLMNQIFFFVPFISSFLSAVLIDRFGSKLAIYMTLALACVRNSSRALLFSRQTPGWQRLKFVYWGGQRLFTALTMGLYFCLPLKLSENWFPEEERSLALSLCVVIPIMGTATASLLYPRFIVDAASAQPLATINIVAFLVALLVVCLFVRRSKPAEGPPSERAEANASRARERAASSAGEPTLWSQLGGVIRQRDLILLLLAVCVYDSSFQVIMTILQDIMTSSGMSRVFTGQFMAFNAVLAGAVQLAVSKWLRPKRGSRDPYYTRTCKLLLCAKLATFICFAMSLTLREIFSNPESRREGVELDWIGRNQWWIVVVCTVCYLVTKFCAAPYYNEQLAEIIRGSVSEATTSACQSATAITLYHLLLFLFVRLRQQAQQTEIRSRPASTAVDLDEAAATTAGEADVVVVMEPASYLRSAMFVSAMALAASCLYLAKFDTDMQKRRERLARVAAGANKLAAAAAVTNGHSTADEKPASGGTIEMIEIDTNRLQDGGSDAAHTQMQTQTLEKNES